MGADVHTATGDRVGAELAAHGLRATRQRRTILRALREHGAHPTAAELHQAVLREIPNLSLKTVYEALDAFVEAGLASCLRESGQPSRYDARVDPHYHARCRICGRLDDVPAAPLLPAGAVALPPGFDPEGLLVTVVGRCAACRS